MTLTTHETTRPNSFTREDDNTGLWLTKGNVRIWVQDPLSDELIVKVFHGESTDVHGELLLLGPDGVANPAPEFPVSSHELDIEEDSEGVWIWKNEVVVHVRDAFDGDVVVNAYRAMGGQIDFEGDWAGMIVAQDGTTHVDDPHELPLDLVDTMDDLELVSYHAALHLLESGDTKGWAIA
jgi:hypothetical protein